MDWNEFMQRLPIAKWSVIVAFSLLGALMQRDMTWAGRILAFFIGIMAAVVFAEPLRSMLNFDHSYSDAISAVLAMTGRNWAAYIVRASKNPTDSLAELLDIWRGNRKK